MRQHLFRIGVILKGLDGAVELVSGIVAWVINPVVVVHLVAVLSQDESPGKSHDVVIDLLRLEAHRVLFISKHFLAAYLVGHGFAKVFVVGALLRNKLWAYPAAIAIFSLFIAYEAYRSVLTHGIGLITLTAFDVIVVTLIWMEYQAQKSGNRDSLG